MKVVNKYFSNYVKVFRNNSKEMIIFNGKTGNIGIIPESMWKRVLSVISEDIDDKESACVISELTKKGCLVRDKDEDYRNTKTLMEMNFLNPFKLNLIILPTEKCNFRCIYCYENFKKGKMKTEIIEGIKKYLSFKLKNGVKHLSIGWFGGEPLLAFDVINEMMSFVKNVVNKYKINYSSSITTNGYLLNIDIFKKCLNLGITHYQITLDGPPELHDERRKLASGAGTFNKIFYNIKKALEVQGEFKIIVRVNIDEENLPYIPLLLDITKNEIEKKEKLYFYFRRTFEPPCKKYVFFKKIKYIDWTKEKKILWYLFEETIKRGLNYYWNLTSFKPFGSVCYAAYPSSLCIGSDGKIYKCTVHFDKKINNLGKILPDGRIIIDMEKLIKWIYPYYELNPKCKKCYYLWVCQNRVCPFNSMNDPKRSCGFSNRYFAKYIKKFIEIKRNSAAYFKEKFKKKGGDENGMAG